MGIARKEVFGPVVAAIRSTPKRKPLRSPTTASFGLPERYGLRCRRRIARRRGQGRDFWINAYKTSNVASPFRRLQPERSRPLQRRRRRSTIHPGQERLVETAASPRRLRLRAGHSRIAQGRSTEPTVRTDSSNSPDAMVCGSRWSL